MIDMHSTFSLTGCHYYGCFKAHNLNDVKTITLSSIGTALVPAECLCNSDKGKTSTPQISPLSMGCSRFFFFF